MVIPISCKACNLDKVFRGLVKVENFFGALITMPHKQSVLPLLDYQSEMVSLSTSCNILKLDNFNKIKGDMFDGAGLINLLYEKKIVIEKIISYSWLWWCWFGNCIFTSTKRC